MGLLVNALDAQLCFVLSIHFTAFLYRTYKVLLQLRVYTGDSHEYREVIHKYIQNIVAEVYVCNEQIVGVLPRK